MSHLIPYPASLRGETLQIDKSRLGWQGVAKYNGLGKLAREGNRPLGSSVPVFPGMHPSEPQLADFRTGWHVSVFNRKHVCRSALFRHASLGLPTETCHPRLVCTNARRYRTYGRASRIGSAGSAAGDRRLSRKNANAECHHLSVIDLALTLHVVGALLMSKPTWFAFYV